MKKLAKKKIWLFFVLGILFLLSLWWILSAVMKSQGNAVLLSPWEAIARAAVLLCGNSAARTWTAIGWTLLRLLIGFSISFVLAAILGTLAGLYPNFESFLKPWVIFSRTIPTVAIVILLSALLVAPKTIEWVNFIPCILVFLVAFPLLYESFLDGIKNEDPLILDSLDLEKGHKKFLAVKNVLWPDSWPYVKMALAQGLGLSLKVSVMSEVLCATTATHPGIGSLIALCQSDPMGRIEDIIPYSLITLLLMLILDIPLLTFKSKELEKKKGN